MAHAHAGCSRLRVLVLKATWVKQRPQTFFVQHEIAYLQQRAHAAIRNNVIWCFNLVLHWHACLKHTWAWTSVCFPSRCKCLSRLSETSQQWCCWHWRIPGPFSELPVTLKDSCLQSLSDHWSIESQEQWPLWKQFPKLRAGFETKVLSSACQHCICHMKWAVTALHPCRT